MNPVSDLIAKYNQPVPRYTSYPTVPFWSTSEPDQNHWEETIRNTFKASNATQGISLYLHLPFCESLCTYCGCNKRITRNHGVEPVYLQAILKEWQLYREIFGEIPLIREIHLGGGTPTFFSPENLVRLLNGILADAVIHPEADFSFEGHPNNTTREHLQALYQVGFRRVSYGVQDLSPIVQLAINRIQPFGNVAEVTRNSRETGFQSVNFDLIYGLPFQTPESIRETFEQVMALEPDRIAFYSYAHVPWKEKSQRAYSEADLPQGNEKYALYELGRQLLLAAGYLDVGMDHFAKPTDELSRAKQQNRLHRNFMGYTTGQTDLLLGLGVSAISDAQNGYMQNLKTVPEYYEKLDRGELPLFKGYFLTEEDREFRRHILNIACHGYTNWQTSAFRDQIRQEVLDKLIDLQNDGLVRLGPDSVALTPLGFRFLRNVCSAFDLKLEAGQTAKMFSQAV